MYYTYQKSSHACTRVTQTVDLCAKMWSRGCILRSINTKGVTASNPNMPNNSNQSNGSRRSAFHPTKSDQKNQLAADLEGARWVLSSNPNSTSSTNHPSKKAVKKPQLLDELLTDAGNPLPVGQLRAVAARYDLAVKSTCKDDIVRELDKKIRTVHTRFSPVPTLAF